MKKDGVVDTEVSGLAGIVLLGLGLLISAYLTGCSFKVEMGYHGQTGRDDRVQTELVEGKKRNEKREY